ncbi:DNA pilot protein [Tortoise microvirus 90]|nr:DNA pilot protein [Tortoise microvirus 90]
MPLPALLPALISSGAGLISSGLNVMSQNKANREEKAFAEQMYERQRRDNEAQWHMQNEYNSPQSQMNRLKQAGLNPNLVYGSGADNVSSPMPSVSSQSYSPTAPQYDLMGPAVSGLDSYYNYALKEAQIDNVKTQTTVAAQEAALKAADLAGRNISNEKGRIDLGLKSELRDVSAEYVRESLRKLQADTNFQLSENERRLITTSQNVLESAERILSSRAQRANTRLEHDRIQETIKNLRSDNQLKQLDIELRRMGITSSDPIYMRVLGRLIGSDTNNTFKSIDNKTRQISSGFKDYAGSLLDDLFK